MMDDLVFNKKESIERCVLQIRRYYAKYSDMPFEEDFFKQDAIALNLQRATELCIDLGNHVIRTKKLGIPKESRDTFKILANSGILTKELGNRLQGMVGFRNILVHEYKKIDVSILKNVIETQLDDLIDFTVMIMKAN